MINLMRKIKPYLPLSIIKLLSFLYFRVYMRYLCLYLDFKEKAFCKKNGYPIASLRFRVNGTPDIQKFLSEGKRCSEDLENALARTGRKIDSFKDILDFGCGCGRTIRWFEKFAAASSLNGTDIDSVAIDYCRQNFANMEFSTNQPLPPLKYMRDQFDLVYSISVFTHISEEYQLKWLVELARIVKPGGIVLLSVHGSHNWSTLPADLVTEIHAKGFLYIAENIWKGIFPSWYQTAFHKEEYVWNVFSKFFHIIEYIPQGISDFQDLIVMEKR